MAPMPLEIGADGVHIAPHSKLKKHGARWWSANGDKAPRPALHVYARSKRVNRIEIGYDTRGGWWWIAKLNYNPLTGETTVSRDRRFEDHVFPPERDAEVVGV